MAAFGRIEWDDVSVEGTMLMNNELGRQRYDGAQHLYDEVS